MRVITSIVLDAEEVEALRGIFEDNAVWEYVEDVDSVYYRLFVKVMGEEVDEG